MLVVSYDISNDKLRTRLAKFLSKFGYRLQYSVFQIRNSERMLNNITLEIEGRFAKQFTPSDSVIIFVFSKTCKVVKFGYARNDDEEIIFVS